MANFLGLWEVVAVEWRGNGEGVVVAVERRDGDVVVCGWRVLGLEVLPRKMSEGKERENG